MGDWTSRALADIEAQASGASGVGSLRAAIMRDGVIDASEVQKLLAIHKSGAPPSGTADWNQLLVEVVVDYFAISREVPHYTPEELRPQYSKSLYQFADDVLEAAGIASLKDLPTPLTYAQRLAALSVSPQDADLLIDALSANGDVLDAVEIRLMAGLFARAVSYPPSLRAFAWRAMEATVRADGVIHDDEVGLIRALIMGPASFEGEGVSRNEAEALFEMDKAIADDKKSGAWPQFFAQAVGCYVLYEGATAGTMDVTEKAWLSAQETGHSSAGTLALALFLAKWDGQSV